MRDSRNLNYGWKFSEGFPPGAAEILLEGQEVTLPHNAVDLPLQYFDERLYQREFRYQKTLDWQADFGGREVHLQLDGAMADATVYLNGVAVASHTDGFTPILARLTDLLTTGENLLSVRLSGEENPLIPPFGGQIDYLTYAGLYRDAWIFTTGRTWIDSVKIETPDPLAAGKTIRARFKLSGADPYGSIVTCRIMDAKFRVLVDSRIRASEQTDEFVFSGLEGLDLWDVDSPILYRAELTVDRDGSRSDRVEVGFGFRSAEFTPDGFLLNGRPMKIIGLNRHQSYPYVGYAMGRRAQERDAEILKHELHCNLVRTSHYPQSPWFLDHCDRIGLLVFEEIPGWQHIGGVAWKERAVENVGRMIKRDWNHPSIVLWGVRINESPDDNDLYARTNQLARDLDPTRQTAGVRNFAGSELLEDVYTVNDFVCGSEEQPGTNRGRVALRRPSEMTCLDNPVPYLVTEFNGHMHPTKIWDCEQRQLEHVVRYLQILNAAFGDPQISGCIGWCMADYNTHKDFGAGDRICHHGVLDMFRIPKFAASVFASQSDPEEGVVLVPVTWWARGERSMGGVLPLTVLTNCEEVELHFGADFMMRFQPDRTAYPNLPHPPVTIDHRSIPQGCLGAWGTEWEDARLVALLGGKAVSEVRLAADPVAVELRLSADSDHLLNSEKDGVRVVVEAIDQVGMKLPFLSDALHVQIDGPAKLLGPEMLALRGGSAAFWIESVGSNGTVRVIVTSSRFQPAEIELSAKGE